MNKDWKKYKLCEIAEIKYGKDHKHIASGNIPIYGSGGIMRFGDTALYEEESILIPRKGTLSNLFFINTPFWSVDTMFYTKIKEGVNAKYLYYNLKTLDLASMDVGSAVPSLTTELLNKIEIQLPELKEQQAIAEILSSLDDKIELNLQSNKTLEEIANALYKHWFVDFGPFKNGKFVDSELGLIPKGFNVVSLKDVCSNHSRTFNFKNKEKVIFINTGDILEGKFLHNNYSNIDGLPGQAKKIIEPNDILFSEIRPGNKRYALINFDASEYVVSTKFMVIRANEQILPRILYRIFRDDLIIKEFQGIAESRSGTFPQITFDAISHINFVMSNIEIQNQFMEKVLPLENLIESNNIEIEQLKETRDYLLPKLISGEIRVKEAAKKAQEVL